MNDLATLLSRPRIITLDSGRKIRFAPLTIDDMGDLQAWLDDQQPSAFDVIEKQIARGKLVMNGDGKFHRVPYPIDEQKFLKHEAAALDSSRRYMIGREEAHVVMHSKEGLREMTRLCLRKGTPDVTDEEIDVIFGELSREQLVRIVDIADVMGPTDPKASRDGTNPADSDPSPSTGGPSSTG